VYGKKITPNNGMINPLYARSTNVVNIQRITKSKRGKNAPSSKPSITIFMPSVNYKAVKHLTWVLDVRIVADNINGQSGLELELRC
jgi:hypothetical protein